MSTVSNSEDCMHRQDFNPSILYFILYFKKLRLCLLIRLFLFQVPNVYLLIPRPEESRPTKKLKVDFQSVSYNDKDLSLVPGQFAKMPITLKQFGRQLLSNECFHCS